jgi:hypothetical protein
MRRFIIAALAGCASILAIACGSSSSSSTSNPSPQPTATIGTTSAIAPPIPPTPSLSTQTPGSTFTPAPGSTPVRIDAPPGQPLPNPAPIRDASVIPSSPSKYTLHVVAGLFGACAKQGSQDVSRDATSFKVTVTNLLAAGVTCTLPESTYELNIDLPGPFVSGTLYNVSVNGKNVSFTAT